MFNLEDNFFIFLVIFLLTIPFKGWALWRAAKNNHKNWFIVLLILNTFAVLDILYIFIFGKKTEENN